MKTLTLIIVMCTIGFILNVSAESVDIPDANLRRLIEEALSKSIDVPIAEAEILTLTALHAKPGNISDLTGIQYATNLTELNLRLNDITDISLLASLTKLTVLVLDRNDVSDITALAGLTKLDELDLNGNNISDASPLVGLTSLTYVNLEDNPLDQASIETHIPAIKANGARVDFDLPTLREDVNEDGVVDILDLVLVASQFGHACPNEADINGDEVINIQDLVLVAQAFGSTTEE